MKKLQDHSLIPHYIPIYEAKTEEKGQFHVNQRLSHNLYLYMLLPVGGTVTISKYNDDVGGFRTGMLSNIKFGVY